MKQKNSERSPVRSSKPKTSRISSSTLCPFPTFFTAYGIALQAITLSISPSKSSLGSTFDYRDTTRFSFVEKSLLLVLPASLEKRRGFS
jgi:hypothetical protein